MKASTFPVRYVTRSNGLHHWSGPVRESAALKNLWFSLLYAQGRDRRGLDETHKPIYFKPMPSWLTSHRRYWCPLCLRRRVYAPLRASDREWCELQHLACTCCNEHFALIWHGLPGRDATWYLASLTETSDGGFWHVLSLDRQPVPANKLLIVPECL